MTKKTPISLYLDNNILTILDEYCEKEGHGANIRNAIINEAISNFLQNKMALRFNIRKRRLEHNEMD